MAVTAINSRISPQLSSGSGTNPTPVDGYYQEWIDAIKDRSKRTTSGFEYSGRLTETMLLGNIATIRAGDHKVLDYDAGACGLRMMKKQTAIWINPIGRALAWSDNADAGPD